MNFVKRLALSAALLSTMAGAAFAQNVDFYHDKANWQDAFTSALAKAPAAVTSTPYADTSSYQAAVRAARSWRLDTSLK